MTEASRLPALLALAMILCAPALAEAPLPPPRPPEVELKPESQETAPEPQVAAPEPPPRPADLDTSPAIAKPEPAPAPPAEEAACVALLASGEVRAERSATPGDNGACAIADGVTLRAVKLADGKEVTLAGGVTVRCAFAASIAQWVREDVAPRVAADGAVLQGLSGIGGLECRTRNHQPGAKISEHARGAALDMRELVTSAGHRDMTKADDATKALRTDMRRFACARFTTVLGPGSDSFHATHIHMDMAERRSGYRMCQWDVE